ncbi:SacI homology domain-containing protein [Neohortaea acidophila]|uniref:SacI homology domain-containing protein n=1 Tax=Neohortaea acidophila TaxID=245834 RepID=A0A6A6Q9L4_9PEZI|nr:SacI homology domain-containing protein [Neohortaea acidophila]KAF2488097.1 SacI homology domain-containing protein [Neohortaea acidophila]
MDLGPVDSAPSGDTQYDEDPTRQPSPEPEQLRGRRRTHLGSGDHSSLNNTDHTSTDGARDRRAGRAKQASRDSTAAPSVDAPAFFPVGATAAEVYENDGESAEIRSKHTEPDEVENNACRLYKFTLYETNARYWITGSDLAERNFRMLRIDRTSPPGQIALFEDETTYDRAQLKDVLASIDEGNQSTGGLRMKCHFWGLLGFVRFTESYYMLLITKRQQVAMIGGHYVYQIDGTELVPLTTGSSNRFVQNRNPEESRFLSILGNLDLTKSFYFSYSYDITNSLQTNFIRQRTAVNQGQFHADHDCNSMFVWNSHLLQPALAALKRPLSWCLPIIHGFIHQAALDIFGRAVYIAIIGRRSRFFAGARFLKRGVNDQGYVANDVETEQIVSEKLTTSFHAPGSRLYASPMYTSFVHHRGSIPLYWTQDNSGVTPKPAIDLHLQDPFYQPAALHFDNMFERYGCPVYVLNLIKARERIPRESKLLVEFQKCIEYLNQSLPEDKKILYKAFDMSRESKTRGGDVIGSLEVMARDIVEKTGFFRNGDDLTEPMVQNGICRTNCIDCLDRTNAAQFVIGKRAFALQLQALGVIDRDEVDFDTDAMNTFTHMFHDHGDTIAWQYGGSHLVNTMATYRKLNHWQSQSRDMVESFKRYYHNSFLDSQRQDAYNLFLGNYVWEHDKPMLWDLTTDYYLHHSNPRAWLEKKRRNYNNWFTPAFLETRSLPPDPVPRLLKAAIPGSIADYDDYWAECYRPAALSSLGKVYAYRMTSLSRHAPERFLNPHSKFDFSPFKIRHEPQRQAGDTPEKKTPEMRVKIVEPTPPRAGGHRRTDHSASHTNTATRIPSNGSNPTHPPEGGQIGPQAPSDAKAQKHLWTLNKFHTQSLNPTVSPQEAHEYTRYIAHPHTLPLVVSSERIPPETAMDYISYIHKAGGAEFDDFDQEEADRGFAFSAGAGEEEEVRRFEAFLAEARRGDVLSVGVEDGDKKRYKAYRQWVRGKSLFKQSKVDPEYAVK